MNKNKIKGGQQRFKMIENSTIIELREGLNTNEID